VRLIRSGLLAPALNLALDEALLRSGQETLRFYGWDPPGLSLGFFQHAAEFDPVPAGFEMVRRPTGGGAIAHTGELTIAWVGSRRRVDAAYARMNLIVADALRRFGVETTPGSSQPEAAPRGLCFDAHTCYDLLARGKKIFGSAQRRAGERFLLHGTLVLEPNPLSKGAISLRELVGRREAAAAVTAVAPHEMEQALIAAAPWDLVTQQPTAAEWKKANRLVLERYRNDAWTRRR